jgi:DNA-binding beta-propeller fold protein YncE
MTTENLEQTPEQAPVRRRGPRGFLVAAIAILLAVLVGVLYLLWSMVNLPERKPALANQAGVTVAFEAFGGDFGQLDHPLGVAYDPTASRLYVTEPTAGRVLVFDDQGKNGRIFAQDEGRATGKVPKAGTSVTSPEGVDVGADGTVYVADPVKNAVIAFSPEGKKLRQMAFEQAIRVTVDNNRLYVLRSPGTLVVANLQGQTLNRFGTQGTGPNNLYGPTGVAVDSKHNAFITDSQNFRLLALDATLKPFWNFGQPGTSDAQMSARPIELPTGITIGGDGNLYVVDGMASQIKVYDRKGKDVSAALSSRGNADDQLALPQTIRYMKDDLFVIADQFHNRVVGFRLHPQPLKSKAGK